MATETSADTRRGDVAVPAQPCRYGGYELAVPTWFAGVIELARGCPSAEDFPIEVSRQFDLMAGNLSRIHFGYAQSTSVRGPAS